MWTLIITLVFASYPHGAAVSVASVDGFTNEAACLNTGRAWAATAGTSSVKATFLCTSKGRTQ